MNRRRQYGQDVPFCDWLRHHDQLPSAGSECGFVATDVDLAIHRYMTTVDGVGTREVQHMMQLEVKTRGGQPGKSQCDTLFKQHCASRGHVQLIGESICHCGVAILLMDGTRPDDSSALTWGRFNRWGRLRWRPIDQAKLLALLRFEINPDSLKRVEFVRDTDDGSIVLYEMDNDGQMIPLRTITQTRLKGAIQR